MRSTVVVLVTCPTLPQARRLANAVVRKRLAACVNCVPGVESLFWWGGKVDRAREALLIMKTTSRRFPQLQRAIRSLHPYQVPEILAVPVSSGSPPYLAWVASSVSASRSRRGRP